MAIHYPNHPLYDQLCDKVNLKLPELGFKLLEQKHNHLTYLSNYGLTITIQHEGYDMPSVYFGTKDDFYKAKFLSSLESSINPEIPITKKHQKLKSFYDLEYELDIIRQYSNQILQILNNF